MALSGLARDALWTPAPMLKLQSDLRQLHHLDERECAAHQKLLGTFSQLLVVQACGKESFNLSPTDLYIHLPIVTVLFLCSQTGAHRLHAC